MKRLPKILLRLVGLFAVYFLFILIFGTLRDYKPPLEAVLSRQSTPEAIPDSVISLTIWNVGYGGLGAESDFFYDDGGFFFSGGKMVHSPKDMVDRYEAGIEQTISGIKSDFFLLQEVDFASKRSYYINQYEQIGEQLKPYFAVFGINYKVDFVPLPLLEPWRFYGRTESGLASYSRFEPATSVRYQLPGEFGWPTRIFQLDRCALVQRFPVKNGKELLVINVHNSAYDKTGKLKAEQMAFLKDLFFKAYEAGNYVIAGGDWNQCPPFFRFDGFMPGRSQGHIQTNIDPEFLPSGWQWVYDPGVPTNRKTRTVYRPGETFITIIDFFLISPNIRVRQVKAVDTGFRYSDHQPVWMEVEIM